MKTTKGATMSPRMERLWRYIKHERRIPLSDFSTDAQVERVYKQLKAAYEAAPTDELKRDLRCIMRRRPQNRVKGQRP